ncbi:sensor histidine kinase [Alkalicoccobacillus porphyridii]|uniref:histidine kinase n=1 Tax=Alkalicoccobacillus porphyridii TaxID=2597270 RepID=A0A553ZUY1_9BACI|nr:sensor histidine kinase [Alkalicoccobacillus porphyridii]TSB45267.1 HAMP domain-containing histidine kinase [Alkalicoccobacillus porphyridii]
MKLFWRDHTLLITVYILQMLILISILFLDPGTQASSVFYAIFLSFLLLTGYLIYRFIVLAPYYRKLNDDTSHHHDFKIDGSHPMIVAHNQLMTRHYNQHQAQLHQLEIRKNQQVQFMTQWVHQMKTPVSVMNLITQNEQENEEFPALRTELKRLEKGLDLALHTARFEQFEQDFRVKSVHVQTIIQQVVQENKRLFILKELYPKLTIDQNLYVSTDPKWLLFMLDQLVVNAIKYTRDHGKQLSIEANVVEGNPTIQIIDQGVGIQSADLPMIHRPFYTGENGRKYGESTGMGLHLVHELCEKLRIQFLIESEYGKGTTASLIFVQDRS